MERRWLEQRRQGWYAVMDVPSDLRTRLGKGRMVKSLGTRDLGQARKLRHGVISGWHDLFQGERGRLTDGELAARGDLSAEARLWRQRGREAAERDAKAALDGSWAETFDIGDGQGTGYVVTHAMELLAEVGDRAEELGAKAPPGFFAVAAGEWTLLSPLVDPWLAESGGTGKTKLQHRKAVAELTEWSGGEVTLERVTRKGAGEFVTKRLLGRGLSPKTVNRYLSSLSMLWKWLAKRGHLDQDVANPWQGQGVAVKGRRGAKQEAERPFTDGEVAALLGGPSDPLLADLVPLAALSGMRIEELCQLRVRDCQGGAFTIREGKTEAAARSVPVHTLAAPVVARRCADKKPSDFLFHELDASGPDDKRSAPASKRFTRYRRGVGVDDTRDGLRRSLVNFHSFRRWFITKAEQAGIPGETLKIVVGHKREDITFGVYSGGPSDEQKRACVEAIRLPDGASLGAVDQAAGRSRASGGQRGGSRAEGSPRKAPRRSLEPP